MIHSTRRGVRPLFTLLWLPAIVSILNACTTVTPLAYPNPIEFNPAQRAAFAVYEDKPVQKAFAVSPDGMLGEASFENEANRVVRSALSTCQRVAIQPCRVVDISGVPYQPAYLKFSVESRNAIAAMKVPPDIAYHLEAMDWGVDSAAVATGANTYHAPTPLVIPNVKSLSTAQLADRLKAGTITLIDSRGFVDEDLPTIPSAYFIDWAGTSAGPAREPTLKQNLAKIMQLLAPDRDKPIAVFCWSAQCWISIHAAVRLQALGYKNVFWYRGGIEAWKAAKLPVVTAVPHATVWSE